MHTNPNLCKESSSLPLLIAMTLFAVLAFTVQASAQQTTSSAAPDAGKAQVTIRYAPIKPMPADSGQQMYAAYCATCHGANGKGDGSAASALKEKPIDLTLLSARNNGRFPFVRVKRILTDVEYQHAHGSTAMPNWYPAFRSLDRNYPLLTNIRIHNLVSYLEKLQVSSAAADKALQANPR